VAWLLLMMVCTGSCYEAPIDGFPTQTQCEQARDRATVKQKLLGAKEQVIFSCMPQGHRRAEDKTRAPQ
jgi:hypothetical protein